MPVSGFERVCIGVEGKAGMRRSSRTTASISNAAIRVKVRAMEAENRCAVGMFGWLQDNLSMIRMGTGVLLAGPSGLAKGLADSDEGFGRQGPAGQAAVLRAVG